MDDEEIKSPRAEGDRLAIAVAVEEHPLDRRPVRRARLANSVVPGLGLIMRDRVAAGLALGLAFWLTLATALFAAWVWPTLLSRWTVAGLGLTALGAYLLSQILLGRVLRERDRELADFAARTVPRMRAAYRLMAEGNWVGAQIEVEQLLQRDAEHFEARLTLARLAALQDRRNQAEQAYALCRRIGGRRWGWEIDRELRLLR